MRDQIVDTEGRPVQGISMAAEAFNAALDAACFPLMTAGGRMYTGLTKTQLYAGLLFAKHFNPAEMDDKEKVVRLARRCLLGAEVLAAEAAGAPL